jgi:hypothetical protein
LWIWKKPIRRFLVPKKSREKWNWSYRHRYRASVATFFVTSLSEFDSQQLLRQMGNALRIGRSTCFAVQQEWNVTYGGDHE